VRNLNLGPNQPPSAGVSFRGLPFGFYLGEPLEKIVIESPSAIALYDVYVGPTSVPEPSAVILVLFGIAGYFVIQRFCFNLKPTKPARPGTCAGLDTGAGRFVLPG